MKAFIFRLLFLFVLVIFACKTVKITPPKPQPFSNVEPPKPNSIIGLPINIFTEGIAKSINKKFIGTLYKDTSFTDNENDKVKYDIVKRADIKVITANNALEIQAPLHVNFTYLFKFFGVDKTISNSLNLTVKFTTNPMIDRDWNLVLNSKGKIVWDDLPVINLGITKLDLPNMFGTLIQGFVNKMALKIDGKVRKGFIGKKVKGIIYATGVPIYNPKNKSIEIKQFDYDLKTRDVLVKAATWLLNSKEFKQNIENNLVYSIADKLNEARLNANDAVNTKMLDLIDIKGYIKSLEPADIYVTPTALVINIISEGNMEINLNGF